MILRRSTCRRWSEAKRRSPWRGDRARRRFLSSRRPAGRRTDGRPHRTGQHRGGLPRPCREVSQHDDVRRIQRLILRRALICHLQPQRSRRCGRSRRRRRARARCVVVDNNSTDDTAARFEGFPPSCRCRDRQQPRHRRDDGRHRGHHRRRRAHRAGVHRRIHRLFRCAPLGGVGRRPHRSEFAGRPAWMSRTADRIEGPKSLPARADSRREGTWRCAARRWGAFLGGGSAAAARRRTVQMRFSTVCAAISA